MPSPGDPIWEFCGFANGSSFRTKYFMDESTMTLTPCGEFALIMTQSVPLFLFTIINFFLISSNFPRFDRSVIKYVFTIRVLICIATSVLLSIAVGLSIYGSEPLKAILLIEYGFIAAVWALFGLLWMLSIVFKSWTHSTGISVSVFFASKVFYLITVNRWILYGFKDIRNVIPFSISMLQIVYTIVNIFEWRFKKSLIPHQPISDYVELNPKADEGSGLLSRIFFCWTNDLIKKGGKRQLNSLEDVFQLPPSLKVSAVDREMIENSPTFFSDGQRYSLSSSLLHTFGISFFSLALLRVASDAFTFGGPILLHLLVEALETDVFEECFILAGLMILTSFLAAIFSTNFNYYVQKISLRVRTATVTTIYDKLLTVPMCEMSGFSSGKILNFISTDVDRIVNFCNSFHSFWSLPVQMVVALYLLYREVGMAFISGVISAVILIPINKVITNAIGKMSEKLMHAKDQRIKMTTETVNGIRTVKMSSWEDHFENMINELRKKELYYLKIRKYLDAVCVYLWAAAPLLITVSILTTYTLVLHEKLTAAKVFTALALVNILIMPLNAFPWVLNGLIEALVSVRRLNWFFDLNNIDILDLYSPNQDPRTLLTVKHGNFYWKGATTRVSSVDIHGSKGMIIGVSGAVGCGKSTLLMGLLGETKNLAECISVNQESIDEGIGYLGQERWLSRGTVKDNILAGKKYDAELYDSVLQATCLSKDIQLMPGGDLYEISDNGSSLSGGQRTRLALARALYQDNSIYILDEPFASLDRKVADTIWVKGVESLKKSGKLVIVATHDVRLLTRADHILVLNTEGKVCKRGPPEEVLDVRDSTVLEGDLIWDDKEMEMEQVVPVDEEKQVGAVKANIYGAYCNATGVFLSSLIIAALFFMQLTKNGADWWLSRWTESKAFNFTNEPLGVSGLLLEPRQPEYLNDEEWDRSVYFLTIYCSIAAVNSLFTLSRAFLFAYGGVVAAEHIHASLLHRLLQASTSWWDRTPAGRVINRLCSDVYTIDDNLPFQFNILLASSFNLIGALTISVIGLPLLAPLLIILFIVYYFIQKYYRKTTVELKRLSSLSLSPFYSHMVDTVNGLVNIRAQRFVERFTITMRQRLTDNLRAQFSSLAASQWLSMRLSLIAVTVVAGIAITAIIQHRITGVDSGLVGLAITYALSMTSLLNGLLGSFIETEKEMISVERVQEYLQNVRKEEDNGKVKINYDINGRIDFASVSLRYARGSPLALENVCIRIEAGQRVAIVGRTGSGKSSLFQALLRTVNLESGRISVDGTDIRSFALSDLRSMFGLVPQHPFIFSGTLFENLVIRNNTANHHTVAKIVRIANLENLLTRIGGLDGIIEEGGKNLSFGEKQVIAICRILISKPKIVLIDEATSHLDVLSHNRMSRLISAHLPLVSVLSIVHNTSDLSEYDLLIQMQQGKVVEVRNLK